MNDLTITTGWVGDGKSLKTAFRPAVCADHPLLSWQLPRNAVVGKPLALPVSADLKTLYGVMTDAKYYDPKAAAAAEVAAP